MSGGRTRTTQNTTGSTQQSSTATGTPFAQNILDQTQGQNVIGQVFAANDGGYQGDREAAAPIRDSMFANWGPTPTTFVPQQTTAQAPNQVQQTAVDPNYQPGIDAGITNANAQSGALQGVSDAGVAGVTSAINSPHLGFDQMLASLRGQHNIAAAQSTNALAEVAGSQGAFGGTSFARDNAMQSGELQRAFDDQAAELLWNDQARRDQWLRDGAGVAGQYAGVGDLTAQRLLNYGGMQQENLQNTANVNETNAQRDSNNQWLAGTLNDTNASNAAQDSIAQWEAAFQAAQQSARNDTTRAALEQGNAQSGLNNDYYRWAGNQESLDQMLQRLALLMQTSATAPGGSSTGQSTQQSTTTQQSQPSTLSMLGGLASAGIGLATGNPATALGGFGSLTGGAQGGGSMLPQVPTLASLFPTLYPRG